MITLYLSEPYVKALDTLVNQKFYASGAEAIQVAVRDLLNSELWRVRK